MFFSSFDLCVWGGCLGFIKMGFNAKMEVLCSKEFKVCGAIGPCTGSLTNQSIASAANQPSHLVVIDRSKIDS